MLFFLPLCCPFFIYLWILITPLVTLNSSSYQNIDSTFKGFNFQVRKKGENRGFLKIINCPNNSVTLEKCINFIYRYQGRIQDLWLGEGA